MGLASLGIHGAVPPGVRARRASVAGALVRARPRVRAYSTLGPGQSCLLTPGGNTQ
jgi:hypothetical protein